jgi:hypothetical protein
MFCPIQTSSVFWFLVFSSNCNIGIIRAWDAPFCVQDRLDNSHHIPQAFGPNRYSALYALSSDFSYRQRQLVTARFRSVNGVWTWPCRRYHVRPQPSHNWVAGYFCASLHGRFPGVSLTERALGFDLLWDDAHEYRINKSLEGNWCTGVEALPV